MLTRLCFILMLIAGFNHPVFAQTDVVSLSPKNTRSLHTEGQVVLFSEATTGCDWLGVIDPIDANTLTYTINFYKKRCGDIAMPVSFRTLHLAVGQKIPPVVTAYSARKKEQNNI